MKQHEREFFINTIRSGNIYIKHKDLSLVIKPTTYLQDIEAYHIYTDTYDEALEDGLMTEEDVEEMMMSKGIWTPDDEAVIKTVQKDLERLKVEIFKNHHVPSKRESIRRYIRAAENAIVEKINQKQAYFSNTCEGVAAAEKLCWVLSNTTYLDNKIYDFSELSLDYIIIKWRENQLSDNIIRELARNDPWRSLWFIKEKTDIQLFFNERDANLTENQKAIVVWSKMYDNVQESMDPPEQKILDDDDALDGWFIVQSRKREKERKEREFEQKHDDKIKNSSEIFVVGKEDDVESIEDMNSYQSKMIKKERASVINKTGNATQNEFTDEKMKLQRQSNESFRNRSKGR
jgi:hypothetical protein